MNRQLAIVWCIFGACNSPSEPSDDSVRVTDFDGERVVSTRTATGTSTEVFSRAGALVFTTSVAGGDYTWSTADGRHHDRFALDVGDLDLESLNVAAYFQFQAVQEGATLPGMRARPAPSGDVHGCNGFPKWWDCTDFGGCCDVHDACYHRYGCTSRSWLPASQQPPECMDCNREIIGCFVGVVRGTDGGPSSCCEGGEPVTCGEPWCYNDGQVTPCTNSQCCGSDGLCFTPPTLGCDSGTACLNDAYCVSGACVENLCTGSPLTVTPDTTDFDCATGVVLTASGGVPPYSWSTTAGVLSGSGDIVTLTAPPNPGSGLSGTAYSIWDGAPGVYECSGGHSSCNWGWACIGAGGPIAYYTCSGAFNGGTSCGGAFDCVGFGPTCPVDCNAFEAENLASCGTAGAVTDRRSAAQIAGGCNPCALAMSAGATVTITDATGQTAQVTIDP